MTETDFHISKSWDVSQNAMPGEKYTFHKMFPHGEDITISIRESVKGYEVISYAVAHAAEPSETVDGVSNNLEEAIKIAENECNLWDEWIQSYWNKHSR